MEYQDKTVKLQQSVKLLNQPGETKLRFLKEHTVLVQKNCTTYKTMSFKIWNT